MNFGGSINNKKMKVYFIPADANEMEMFEKSMAEIYPDTDYEWNHKTIEYEMEVDDNYLSEMLVQTLALIENCNIIGEVYCDQSPEDAADDAGDRKMDEAKFN